MRTHPRSEPVEATPAPQRGWIFEIEGRHVGAPATAEILEVLSVPGYTMYRVRWEDGSESTLLPSCDQHPHPRRGGERQG
jgi:hypothetical protein